MPHQNKSAISNLKSKIPQWVAKLEKSACKPLFSFFIFSLPCEQQYIHTIGHQLERLQNEWICQY